MDGPTTPDASAPEPASGPASEPLETEPLETGPAQQLREPVVDFAVLGRRLGRTAVVVGVVVLAVWLGAIPWAGVDGALLMNLVGLGIALMFVAEVVIVGGSAVRGLLRAGERGDRLASGGVGLLPPQLTRRQRD